MERYKKATQLFFAARQKIRVQHLERIQKQTDATDLALFFSIDSQEELIRIGELVKKIRRSGKKVMAYVYYPGFHTLGLVTDPSIFFFNLNDFTLFAKEKEHLHEKISKHHYILLIGFVYNPDPICLNLLTELKADLKVGYAHPDLMDVYTLTIKSQKEPFRFSEFYRQVSHYLEILHIGVRED